MQQGDTKGERLGERDADRDDEWLAERFEEYRPHLRSVAYRMLGSLTEADDAVQDTWLRLSRAGVKGVDNLGGWLTTIVARISLNSLRSRNTRREDPLQIHVPDPVVQMPGDLQPEEEAILADSIGLAMMVVLDTLSPAERLAFVLHDMFDLPFDEIAHPWSVGRPKRRASWPVELGAVCGPPGPRLSTSAFGVVSASARGRRRLPLGRSRW